jgi:hypothetical protein
MFSLHFLIIFKEAFFAGTVLHKKIRMHHIKNYLYRTDEKRLVVHGWNEFENCHGDSAKI